MARFYADEELRDFVAVGRTNFIRRFIEKKT